MPATKTKKSAKLKFYLGRRSNPQLGKPYYNEYGQITQKRAKEIEDGTIYGAMYLTPFDTEEAYRTKIAELKADGFTVYTR
jgi:hypothetical protein